MTHPTLFVMLAADRHAELVREAETYRVAAAARAAARASSTPRTRGGVALHRRLLPSRLSLRRSSVVCSPSPVCCA